MCIVIGEWSGHFASSWKRSFQHLENVISWKRSALAAGVKTQWRNSQDFILYFSKIWQAHIQSTIWGIHRILKKHYSHKDERGIFQPVPIFASGRSNGATGAVWRGFDPNRLGKNGMHWLKNPTVLDELDAQGLIYWPNKRVERHALSTTNRRPKASISPISGTILMSSTQWLMSIRTTTPKSPKRSSNASSNLLPTKATLWLISSAAPAPRWPWRKNSTANGSAATWVSSPSTRRERG